MLCLTWLQTVIHLMVFIKDFFENIEFRKTNNPQVTKNIQNYPACKEINLLSLFILCKNSEDPDEMHHNALFAKKNNLKQQKYIKI